MKVPIPQSVYWVSWRRNLFRGLVLFCLLFFSATNIPGLVLVGSTPGEGPIASILSIPSGVKVDFIRWNLTLEGDNTFELKIVYGGSQPNTLGFTNGGEERDFRGSFDIDRSLANSRFKEVYRLKSDQLKTVISLVKVNENVFHILTTDDQLMVGNGGWSFSLNRANPVPVSGDLMIVTAPGNKRSRRVVFDGRTPCQEVAADHPEMRVSASCFKLKWRLILERDSITFLPSKCTIRKVVDNKPVDVSGSWSIVRGTPADPDAVVYKIETGDSDEAFLLLADEKVLFFLDPEGRPYVGNEDFSFTLNQRE